MSIRNTVQLLSQGVTAEGEERRALIDLAAQSISSLKPTKANKTKVMKKLREVQSATNVLTAGLLLINSTRISKNWKDLLKTYVESLKLTLLEKGREAVGIGDEQKMKTVNAMRATIAQAQNHPNWDSLPGYQSFSSDEGYPPVSRSLLARLGEVEGVQNRGRQSPRPRSLRNFDDEDVNKNGWVGDDHPFHGRLGQKAPSEVYDAADDSDATDSEDHRFNFEEKADEPQQDNQGDQNPGDMSFGHGERHEPLLNRKNRIVATYDKEQGFITTLDDKNPKTYVPWEMVEEQARALEAYQKQIEELQNQVKARDRTLRENFRAEEERLASGLNTPLNHAPDNFESSDAPRNDPLDEVTLDDDLLRAFVEVAQRPVRAVMERQHQGSYSKCPKNVSLEGWLSFVNRFREDAEDNDLEGNTRYLRIFRKQFQVGSLEEMHFQRFKRDHLQRYGEEIPFNEMVRRMTELKLGSKTRTYWIERAASITQGSSSVSEYIARFSHETEMFEQFADIKLTTAHFENGLNHELTKQLIPFTDVDDLFQRVAAVQGIPWQQSCYHISNLL